MKIARFISYNFRLYDKRRKLFPVEHRGFNYGDGVYETIRVYEGEIFTFMEHMERLRRSLGIVSINFKVDEGRIEREIKKLMRANRLFDCAVRVVITRGCGGGLPPPESSPDITIMLMHIEKKIEECQKKGVKVVILSQRRSYEPFIRGAKTINFLPNILGSLEFRKKGAEEGIFLTSDGFVAEGTTSNIFFVKGGILKTPHLETGILAGITRKVIIDIAKENGISVEEGFYTAEELLSADEVFISSTTREIVPVISIDGKVIGKGKPGVLTLKLLSLFKKKISFKVVSNSQR